MLFFQERYPNLINDKDFLGDFGPSMWSRLHKCLDSFDEPQVEAVSRFTTFTTNTTAGYMALTKFGELSGWGDSFAQYVDEERYCKFFNYEWLTIIEIWYSVLSSEYKTEFQNEINTIMREAHYPWMLFDGYMTRIDSRQFELDLQRRITEQIQGAQAVSDKFRGAYDELLTAFEKYQQGDYKSAVLEAEKSYESILKVVLGINDGNAKTLVSQYAKSIKDLPSSFSASGLESNVLSALPYIRNSLKVGHGAGEAPVVVEEHWARLAINLSCALSSFVLDQRRIDCTVPVEEDGIATDEDMPF